LNRARYSSLEHAHERLVRLADVSKLLTKRDAVERTVSSVLGIAAGLLPLRSAILIQHAGGATNTLAWTAPDVDKERLAAIIERARQSLAYFLGPAARGEESDAPPVSSPMPRPISTLPIHSAATSRMLFMPLVVERGPVFGAVQLEADGALDESDLAFANAIVNQLAVALDRDAAIATAQAATEARRADAQRAEQQANDLLAFTRSITSSLAEGIVTVDLAGRITFVNPAATEMLGIAAESALGLHVDEVMRLRRAGGSTRPSSPLLRALAGGESVHSEAYELNGRTGAAFPVSETSSSIMRDGHVVGAVLVFRSIAAEKDAERKARFLTDASDVLSWSLDAKATLKRVTRLTVPFLADVCFVDEVDEDGNVHRQELELAYGTNRSVARRMWSLTPAEDWATPQAAVIASGHAVMLEDLAHPSVRGEGVPAGSSYADVMRAVGLGSMMVLPLVARGRTRGALTLARLAGGQEYNRSDLHLGEEVARRAAMALDNARLQEETTRAVGQRQDILAIVSHDLRNPLNVVSMSLSLLDRHAPPVDRRVESRGVLVRVKRAVARMDHLIRDLLDLQVIESGRLSIETAEHPVLEVAREAIESLRRTGDREDIRLEFGLGDGAMMRCDRDRILQVLTNILGNALKFSPGEGSITLRVARQGSELLFAVIDKGPGMSATVLAHLFERYWRAHTTAGRGNGLGLFISKAVVEAHGGRIWAESTIGRGSTVAFALPASGAS
jgi:PAS domain S-box-containing protein